MSHDWVVASETLASTCILGDRGFEVFLHQICAGDDRQIHQQRFRELIVYLRLWRIFELEAIGGVGVSKPIVC